MITIKLYENEAEQAKKLIKSFWLQHSQYIQSNEDAEKDLNNWTADGHQFYFLMKDHVIVGFIHMGNRGGKIDWLEDIHVLPEYQNQGIATTAIRIMEDIVKEYSISMYIEAAARNEAAIRLYRKLGYNCLNTITVRKDFQEEDFDCIREENIYNTAFEIRKLKSK